MENIIKIAQLLGEDNEKRLKDSITDLLIKRVEDDLNDYHDWIVDLDYLYDKVNKEIQETVKDKMVKFYTEKFEEKLNKILNKQFEE